MDLLFGLKLHGRHPLPFNRKYLFLRCIYCFLYQCVIRSIKSYYLQPVAMEDLSLRLVGTPLNFESVPQPELRFMLVDPRSCEGFTQNPSKSPRGVRFPTGPELHLPRTLFIIVLKVESSAPQWSLSSLSY